MPSCASIYKQAIGPVREDYSTGMTGWLSVKYRAQLQKKAAGAAFIFTQILHRDYKHILH